MCYNIIILSNYLFIPTSHIIYNISWILLSLILFKYLTVYNKLFMNLLKKIMKFKLIIEIKGFEQQKI